MVSARQSQAPTSAFRPSPWVWLEQPSPLATTRRRRHVLVLGLLILLGGAHGVYWAVATPVWSPVDEMAHFAYVQSIADGHGVPVIGQDLVSDDVIVTAKSSPTAIYREQPFHASNTDPNWGPARHQYEATAAPTYYALMVVPYWLGRPFGTPGAILAIRLATLLIGLLAIPITWALARRMLPRHPPAWLVAPLLMVVANSLAFGAVSNDSLAVVLGAASVLLLLRALGRTSRARGAVVLAGFTFGVGIATKATMLTIAPVLATVAVTWWIARRPGAAAAARTAATYAIAAVGAFAPWLVWNLSTYGAISGVGQVNGVLAPGSTSFSFSRLWTEVGTARLGLWANQLLLGERYNVLWLLLAAAAPIVAITVAARRRRPDDVFGMAVGALALPAGFVCSELVNFGLMHGSGAPLGRHLLPVIPFTVIAVSGALVTIVTRRWLATTALAIVTAAFFLESRATLDLLRRSYERTVHDVAWTPIVDQSWADYGATPTAVLVSPSCPVTAVSLGFAGPPPPAVVVRTEDRSWSVPAVGVSSSMQLYQTPTLDSAWYPLPTELSVPFTIDVPAGSVINVSDTDRSSELALVPALGGGQADPVAHLYCKGSDAREVAFARDYAIGHPDAITRDMLRVTPFAATAAAALATIGAFSLALRRRPGHGRSGTGSDTRTVEPSSSARG